MDLPKNHESSAKPTFAQSEHARKMALLDQAGYFDDCTFAPGVTPQNLVSIVGYNLVMRDSLEDLIIKKVKEEYERNSK
jgi:hypothetical protein